MSESDIRTGAREGRWPDSLGIARLFSANVGISARGGEGGGRAGVMGYLLLVIRERCAFSSASHVLLRID